ncbi:hypothetical protein [Streptomyces sp. NRRL WC-3742]|uniref:hypothetical protein n=1 Tax=Streptomyces sp. NRRL WC-3742 TaxID=1463934 RepID=UPI0004C9BD52|nr:hypothetical protein [Streptomyces sp. NRRL WC-3742]
MTAPPTALAVPTELAGAAARGLSQALGGRPLVIAERFTSAARTAYTGPAAIEAARPVLAIGCYRPWQAALPLAVVAAETRTGIRGEHERHTWPEQVDRTARRVLAGLDKPVIAAWYATNRLIGWAGPGGQVAAIDVVLRRQLEDKAFFAHLLAEAGVPAALRIPSVRVETRLPSLADLQRSVGTQRLVVQCGADSGGRGTVFVHDENDLDHASRMRGPYRVSAFVAGWSSNTTVLTVPDGNGSVSVYVDRPSHKAVGVPEAGIGPGKSAGNMWNRPWPRAAAEALVDAAVRVGRWAWHTHRMAGLFGLDAMLTPDGRVQLNEINCRNQGTTEVSAVNQQLRGLPPFLLAHLTVLLDGRVDWLPDSEAFNAATVESAVNPTPGPFYLKIRNRYPHPVVLNDSLPGSGLYSVRAGHLLHLGEGSHPAQANADAGQVLLANLPVPGVVCPPGAEIGTAEGIATATGGPFSGPHDLSPYGQFVLDALDHHLITLDRPEATSR